MTKALNLDLKKLQARAFDRAEWAGEALQRYHSAIGKLDDAVVKPLRGFYKWMFVPTTLWPFNVQDVLEDCLSALEKGKRLNSRHRLLIDLLPEPPDETICARFVSLMKIGSVHPRPRMIETVGSICPVKVPRLSPYSVLG